MVYGPWTMSPIGDSPWARSVVALGDFEESWSTGFSRRWFPNAELATE